MKLKKLLPYNFNNTDLLPLIDKMIRDKKNTSNGNNEWNDSEKKYGLSHSNIERANRIWKKLSQRRLEVSNILLWCTGLI